MGRFPFTDGLAVITGAGSGIGAALSRSLARRGTHLALVDRDQDGLDATRRSLHQNVRVSLHPLDVTDAQAVDALPQAVERDHGSAANMLINNAGVALQGQFEDVPEQDFDWLMDINLHAPIRLTRIFLPHLRTRPTAQIVNISSVFGLIGPAGQTAYSTAKFGLRGFSEALRHELDGTTVGVTVVHPGGISTQIARNTRRTSKDLSPEELEERLKTIETMLVMPPDQAGDIITNGIEHRAKRVLIGSDARRIDRIQRLFPAGYWSILRKQFGM